MPCGFDDARTARASFPTKTAAALVPRGLQQCPNSSGIRGHLGKISGILGKNRAFLSLINTKTAF